MNLIEFIFEYIIDLIFNFFFNIILKNLFLINFIS